MLPKVVVFDFETSGVDPVKDYILEVGLLEEGEEPKSWFVNQTHLLTKEQLAARNAVPGLTPVSWESLERGISPAVSIEVLMESFDKHDLIVGHNIVRFDMLFYAIELKRCGITPENKLVEKVFDTAGAFKGLKLGMIPVVGESQARYSFKALETRAKGLLFNLKHCCSQLLPAEDWDKVDFHGAAVDAMYTKKLFNRLINLWNLLNFK